MRIEFHDFNDILEEIRDSAHSIHRNTVRVRVDYIKQSEICFDVGVWVTARVTTAEGDYIVEFNGMAGEDLSGGQDGTLQAAAWKKELSKVCEELKLKIRGGKIEMI